jgi:autotransporter-associated beta strand protein
LDLNGRNESTSNLVGTTGRVTNSANGTLSVFTVGETNATSTFAGSIQNGAGRITLVKIGTGTQTLSGANSYTGNTNITAGNLIFSGASSASSTGRSIVVSSGGTATFDFAGLQNAVNRSVSGSSAGAIGVTANNNTENLDFTAAAANAPTLVLGAGVAGVHYSGTITPANNTYRLGNANQLQIDSNLTDGSGGAVRSVNITGNINFQQNTANT